MSLEQRFRDQHPILHHFRKLDDNTVIGVMDQKGGPKGYFHLKRL
jgi:hypothetical protein